MKPVIVLWAHFPELDGEIEGVKVIHGTHLAEWLRSQLRRIANVDHAPVTRAVATLPLAESPHWLSPGVVIARLTASMRLMIVRS